MKFELILSVATAVLIAAVSAPAPAATVGGTVNALAGQPASFDYSKFTHAYGSIYNTSTTYDAGWAVPIPVQYTNCNTKVWASFNHATYLLPSYARMVVLNPDGTYYNASTWQLPAPCVGCGGQTEIGNLYIPLFGTAYADFDLGRSYGGSQSAASVVRWLTTY